MLKKKIVSLAVIGLLSVSLLFGNNTSASSVEDLEEVIVPNVETSEEVTSAAACKNVSISNYVQDNGTNEITFKVTGNPGSEIMIGIYKYLGSGVSFASVNLPASGVTYVTFNIKADGAYEAAVEQKSPCASEDGPLFFAI